MRKPDKGFNFLATVLFFLLGVVYAQNQTLVNNIALAFNANETQMSSIISAFYMGAVSMVLVLGEISERIGKRKGLVIAAVLEVLGAGLISVSSSLPMCLAGMLFLGFGIGGFESLGMSLCEDNNQGSATGFIVFVQAFFSIGGVVTPIVLRALLPMDGYRPAYGVVASVSLCLLVSFLLYRRIDDFASVAESEGALAIFKVARNKRVLVALVIMLCYVGGESVMTYWVISYFESCGFHELSAMALSAYWLFSIVGRVVCARIKDIPRLLPFSFGFAAAGYVLLILMPTPVLKFIGIAVAGVALAPVYGTICYMGGHAEPAHSASAYSLMVFGGCFGGMVFQPIVAQIVSRSSFAVAYCGTAAVFVAAVFAMRYSLKLAREAEQAE